MKRRCPRALVSALLAAVIAAPLGGTASASTEQPPAPSRESEATTGTVDVAEVPVEEPLQDDAASGGEADPLVEAGQSDPGGDLHSATVQTSGLTVVGVTWSEGTGAQETVVVLRTRSGETWSDWETLTVEAEVTSSERDGASGAPEMRDGTAPVFVGAVDEVQAAVTAPEGQRPEEVRLVVVDLGGGASEATATTAAWHRPQLTAPGGIVDESASLATTSSIADVATVAARPTIYSRAQWGADESIMTWTPQVGRVNGAVVHHTAGSNNYTADQVPAIIRGIYTYHAQSRGWGDIGYNFLIDKFGRIWEGRAGGIERAIVGGHAAGVNSQTFGLSLMGNYDQATVPSVAMDAMARLIAWKLSLHGVPANGTAVIDGRTMPAVIGHRDVAQTACPGANLYPRLGELRSAARSQQGDAPFRSLDRDLVGDSQPELIVERGGAVSLLTSGRTWQGPAAYGGGWANGRLFSPGDWNGDGRGDLMFADAAGNLYLYLRTASGWQARQTVGHGWNVMDAITGGHDWDGDGIPDVLARRASDGALWLYPGGGNGKFKPGRQVGWRWHGMSSITMVGDLRNGRPALVARNAEGRLVTYVGDGVGGFATATTLGPGWDSMTALLGPGDANGDGQVDLLARDSRGRLMVYAGDGNGRFSRPTQIGHGWQGFTALAATRTGDVVDVYAVAADGVLRRYGYAQTGVFGATAATGVRAEPGADVLAPGDWDGDGRADLVVRNSAGELLLHRGTGEGSFATTGTRIGHGWGGMVDVVGAPDFLAPGIPGILAVERSSGRIWLYPGNGRGGFQSRVHLASGAGAADAIVSVGAWTGRVPDVVTRERGRLVLRQGNGAGQLGAARQIGHGWDAATAIVGVGDATGDGRPDIASVWPDGTMRLYPGNGAGGFLPAVPIGSVSTGSSVH